MDHPVFFFAVLGLTSRLRSFQFFFTTKWSKTGTPPLPIPSTDTSASIEGGQGEENTQIVHRNFYLPVKVEKFSRPSAKRRPRRPKKLKLNVIGPQLHRWKNCGPHIEKDWAEDDFRGSPLKTVARGDKGPSARAEDQSNPGNLGKGDQRSAISACQERLIYSEM